MILRALVEILGRKESDHVSREQLYVALHRLYEATCSIATVEQMEAALAHPDNGQEVKLLNALRIADLTLQLFEAHP